MWQELIKELEENNYSFYPPATETQIREVEETLQTQLPGDLRSLLQETNGVVGSAYLHLVWNTQEILRRNLEHRTNDTFVNNYMSFDSLLCFADAGNGDMFAYSIIAGSIKRQSIFAWNHEDDSRIWVAPSLKKYLEGWIKGTIKL